MLRNLLMTTTAVALGLALAFPASADPVTLRVVNKDMLTTNPDDVAHLKRIEDAMRAKGEDIHLEMVDLPSSSYADALTVKLLSGDIPDIIYFQGGDKKMADQGILEDLGPWIDKEPNLKAALWPHNLERLKNYPYLLYIYPPRQPQPVIRTDWLEKTGMQPPQTVDDYVKLFEKIRDMDLDGDGQNDTVALTAYGNTDELDTIFDQAFGETTTWMKDADGTWINQRISPQEKDKLTFYKKLADDGLFDKEYVTNTWEVKEDKFYTGKAGVIFGSSPDVIDIYGGKMRQAHPGEDISLTLLPIPKGPGGQGLKAVDVSKETRGFAIASTSQHKQEAADFLDFMASPEGQTLDRMGFEGREYTKSGDSITYTDAIATWYPRFFVAANWNPPADWKSPAAQQDLANLSKWFTADNAFVWPADYAADLDATENVYRSWVAKFITGEASMDQWNQYVSEWKAAGGDRLTDYAKTMLK